MKNIILILLLAFPSMAKSQGIESPEWTKDLIVYEISTKNFTSPNGPGTGTFQSTQKKVPYLAELGINGVWLTGHNWADDKHFYGLWTQYATIRPDSIDSSLGTKNDLKLMVDEFHKYDIKVFLDVVTHGVMNYSPLITENPKWFKSGSWGMTDYDWHGNHKDLDEWWVKTHVDYVLQQGIDGYRLDVSIYRPDLWYEIKRQCAEAGHPIVIFLEFERPSNNVCDFYQRSRKLSEQTHGIDTILPAYANVALGFKKKYENTSDYSIKVFYEDGSFDEGSSLRRGQLAVKIKNEPAVTMVSDVTFLENPDNVINLLISNIDTTKKITKLRIHSDPKDGYHKWNLSSNELKARQEHGDTLSLLLKPPAPQLQYYSVQLSAHDDGWDGFPSDRNPYVAEGSRCLFGYNCLFSPAIPLFMSGEEFNAGFSANPKLTPELFGKGEEGKGTWLYGAVIDWAELDEDEHRSMFNDVKKMISIRKSESDLLRSYSNDTLPDIFGLDYIAKIDLPVPFAIQNEHKIIIVIGNNTETDVKLTVKVPLKKVSINPDRTYVIQDLWNDKKWEIPGKELENFQINVTRDKVSSGGLAIFKITK